MNETCSCNQLAIGTLAQKKAVAQGLNHSLDISHKLRPLRRTPDHTQPQSCWTISIACTKPASSISACKDLLLFEFAHPGGRGAKVDRVPNYNTFVPCHWTFL